MDIKVTDLVAAKMASITSEFIKDPMASIFVNPFVPDESIAESYYKIVKNPMDLKSVKKGISDGKYKTISQWENDFKLIFENAINYNGRDSIISGCAKYLQNKLEQKVKDLEYQNLKTFEDQLIKLRNKLALLMANPPVKSGIRPQIQELETPADDWSVTRLHNLMEKLNEINKEKPNEKILELLNVSMAKENPQDVNINLNKLTRSQLLELEKIVTSSQ